MLPALNLHRSRPRSDVLRDEVGKLTDSVDPDPLLPLGEQLVVLSGAQVQGLEQLVHGYYHRAPGRGLGVALIESHLNRTERKLLEGT